MRRSIDSLPSQRKDFWQLLDGAHKEGEKKGFTRLKTYRTDARLHLNHSNRRVRSFSLVVIT
jgi:hypothetical protein